MSVIVLILKIIAYSILGVVIASIVLLTAVLVLPIDYRILCEKDEHTHINVVSKLFYLIGINYKKDANTNEIVIRLLGVAIKRINLKETSQPSEDNEIESVLQHPVNKPITRDEAQTTEEIEELTKDKPSGRQRRYTPIRTKKHKATSKTQKIKSGAWKDQLKILWESRYRKPAMKKFRQMLGQLCVYFKPHTMRFHLKIGKEDPAETGILIAKLTMMYPLIYRYGHIEGMYEHKGVEGCIEVAGRMRLCHLIGIILRFIIDKNVRSYIKMIMHIRKVQTNGI